ncbi:hypothetical protein [Corynebacterium sp.]|uniref:hypothetical protein n=1 Tax=Corynebacterium sp. TaxID=1720 RepID=UPI0027BB0EEF|nr:hypothetical protein [Corynebacterium sp.]
MVNSQRSVNSAKDSSRGNTPAVSSSSHQQVQPGSSAGPGSVGPGSVGLGNGANSPKNSPKNQPKNKPHNGTTPKFGERPESVHIYVWLWIFILAVEFVHQILNISLALWDPSELQARAARSIEESGQAISDGLLNFGVYGSIVLMGLISLLLLGLLATMLYLVNAKHKRAGLARRMLFFFGLYFTFRLVLIFGTSGNPLSDIPEAFYIIDGNLQVLVGVASALTLIFGGRNETLDYTGELEKMRQLEQELRAEQERRLQQKKEKQAKKQAERRAKDQNPQSGSQSKARASKAKAKNKASKANVKDKG